MFNGKNKINPTDEKIKVLNSELSKLSKRLMKSEMINSLLAEKFSELQMKDLEVKNCPFCGQTPHLDTQMKVVNKNIYSGCAHWHIIENEHEVLTTYKLSCVNCECSVKPTTDYHQGLNRTVEKWNKRAETND